MRKIYLKEWREERGLTQEDLAEKSGYSTATISRIETGEIGYSRESLGRLADALDCEPGDILSRDPTRPINKLWPAISRLTDQKLEHLLAIAKTFLPPPAPAAAANNTNDGQREPVKKKHPSGSKKKRHPKKATPARQNGARPADPFQDAS